MNTINNSGKLYSEVLAAHTSNGNVLGEVSPSTSVQPRISLTTSSILAASNTTGILATPSNHAESSTSIILTAPSPAALPDLVEPPTTVHSCVTCSKSFAQKFNLMRHMKSHAEGSIGFDCKVCDKFFTREDNLIRHAKTHENEEYVCPRCPKSFTRKDALTRHLVMHNKPVKRQQPHNQPSTSTPKRRRAEKSSQWDIMGQILPTTSAQSGSSTTKIDEDGLPNKDWLEKYLESTSEISESVYHGNLRDVGVGTSLTTFSTSEVSDFSN
ncbi:hypothetical protein JTE90_023759 [Oedothorax gibbosus]|uniref:C2H2-type domain-containing protein n=1 Tax=Oedothorax gibbosus TaxID=931172 RepID=A0AAV6TP77_9ARAC|nr:hypothetical protein JTE90_023759 [Oedothorax gibbosus]